MILVTWIECDVFNHTVYHHDRKRVSFVERLAIIETDGCGPSEIGSFASFAFTHRW